MKNEDLFHMLENADDETLKRIAEEFPINPDQMETVFLKSEQKYKQKTDSEPPAEQETYPVHVVKAYGWYKAVLAAAACMLICMAGIKGIAGMKHTDVSSMQQKSEVSTQTHTETISTRLQTEPETQKYTIKNIIPVIETDKPETETITETMTAVMTDASEIIHTTFTTEITSAIETETSVSIMTSTMIPETSQEEIIEIIYTEAQNSNDLLPVTTIMNDMITEISTTTTESVTTEETTDTTETTAPFMRTANPGFYTLISNDTQINFFDALYLDQNGESYLFTDFGTAHLATWDSFGIYAPEVYYYDFDHEQETLQLSCGVIYEYVSDAMPSYYSQLAEKEVNARYYAPDLPEIPGFSVSYDYYENTFREIVYMIHLHPDFPDYAPDHIEQNYMLTDPALSEMTTHVFYYDEDETRSYYENSQVWISLKQYSKKSFAYPSGYPYGHFETSPIKVGEHDGYFLSMNASGRRGNSDMLIWTDENYIYELYGIGKTSVHYAIDHQYDDYNSD